MPDQQTSKKKVDLHFIRKYVGNPSACADLLEAFESLHDAVSDLTDELAAMTERKDAVNETLASVVKERNALRAASSNEPGVAAIPNAGPLATDLLERVHSEKARDNNHVSIPIARARWIIDALSKAENLTTPPPPAVHDTGDGVLIGKPEAIERQQALYRSATSFHDAYCPSCPDDRCNLGDALAEINRAALTKAGE